MEIIIENVTAASEITITEPHIALFSSVFAPIISVGVVVLIGLFTILFNKKLYDRNALIDVFETFDSNHKNSEEIILSAYKIDNNLYNMNEIAQPFHGYTKTVSRNYDQIGLLFERGLIPKKDYYSMYGRITVAIHIVLFEAINKERIMGRKHHLIYFTKLAISCYEYWKNENDLPRDPKSNKDISETSLQAWKDSLKP